MHHKSCTNCNKQFTHKGTVCSTCVSRLRRIKNKQRAIELLGGKCIDCGYKKHPAALQFHHPDNNKEFNLSKHFNRKWEILEIEIKKCVLLCANCHSIEHCKY